MARPLDILYRDDQLVAVNKPAGQLVHPADEPQPGDEVTMKILRDQIGEQVHAVHRLDRPTCGVLLFATTRGAARTLGKAFENQQVKKTYWAMVMGCPDRAHWICEVPIQKNTDSPMRSAETEFRVLETVRDRFALVEARPKTGRFHQIRKHLLHAGHPIVGDYRYGDIDECDRVGEELGIGTRMLLQAKRLCFAHPGNGETVEIEAPLDSLIERQIDSARSL